MKRLAVVISIYIDNEEKFNSVLNKIPKEINGVDFYIVNDRKNNFVSNNKRVLNNEKNLGKFLSVVEVLKRIENEYFITIDFDDIELDNINWKKIENVSKKINKFDKKFDFIVNSYFLIDPTKKIFKKINSKKINVYFNPNLIFNVKNIVKNFDIYFENYEIKPFTMFDDLILLLLSIEKCKYRKMNILFYTYTKQIGVTADKSIYSDEINTAYWLMKEITNKKLINDEKIINYRIKRIEKDYLLFAKK